MRSPGHVVWTDMFAILMEHTGLQRIWPGWQVGIRSQRTLSSTLSSDEWVKPKGVTAGP